MTLHRLTLRPRSPWRTPWQADTLLGMLCVTAARTQGADFLSRHILDPMRAGEPPFVLSDAFPGDWLPIPAALRLADLSQQAGVDRKRLKRARWLARDDFLAARAGRIPSLDRWRLDPFQQELRRHNTLARDSDASQEEGGLFAREDVTWNGGHDTPEPTLSLYARTRDPDALDLLVDLLAELALTGYGADVATGRGQFDLVDGPQPDLELDTAPPDADALIVLSTFQPAPGDPVDGAWEAFPRFGKLGPDLGLDDVRKHTLILFRPGACFRADGPRPVLGHALPMHRILPALATAQLLARGIDVIHPAFGLTIPAHLPEL